MERTLKHFVEYRDTRAGETVLFETDSEGEARFELYPAMHDAHKILIASSLTRACPGYGEDCGTQTTSDLCPDCTMGRMDAQSPRIPV